MECNAPVTETVDGGYACVDCGRNPLRKGSAPEESSTERPSADGSSPGTTSVDGTSLEEAAPDGESSPDGEAAIEDDATFEDDSGATLGVGQ